MNGLKIEKKGNGFNFEKGLSNNAVFAQSCGLIAGSVKLKKELSKKGFQGVPQSWLTANAPACEYHHHGSGFDGSTIAVNYYNLDDVVNWLQLEDLQKAKFEAKKAKQKAKEIIFTGLIQYKEYRYEGAYNSKSLHLVQCYGSLKNKGTYKEITVLSSKGFERKDWDRSRYGRAENQFSPIEIKPGTIFLKKDIEQMESLPPEKIFEIEMKYKKDKKNAKRRVLYRLKKEAEKKAIALQKAAEIEAQKAQRFSQILETTSNIEEIMTVYFANEVHPAPAQVYAYKKQNGGTWNDLRYKFRALAKD